VEEEDKLGTVREDSESSEELNKEDKRKAYNNP